MISTTIHGRLTGEPELRLTGTGMAVANMTVASDNRRDEDGTSFLRVTLWGKTAENAAEHLIKGQAVTVAGRLQQQHWITDDGEKRNSWELTADGLEYGAKPRNSAEPNAPAGAEEPF